MEIFKLSIECLTGENLEDKFLRIIKIPSNFTLKDLHSIIQDLTDFDDDHLAGYYISNSWHGRKKWLTLGKDLVFDDEEAWQSPLSNYFPLPKKKKLYYQFDFGDSWIFEIRKKGGSLKPAPNERYPVLIHEEGPKPEQYRYDD
mgnify:CR=1 FL=1